MTKETDETNLQIIQHLGDGKTYKEISAATGIKYRTIVDRLEEMKKRYDCKTPAQLVLKIVSYNLLHFTEKARD